MTKFKIGDKVRVVKGCYNEVSHCGGKCPFVNKEGIVCEIGYGTYGVNKFKNLSGRKDAWCSGFTKNCLELIDKPSVKPFGIVKFLDNIKGGIYNGH